MGELEIVENRSFTNMMDGKNGWIQHNISECDRKIIALRKEIELLEEILIKLREKLTQFQEKQLMKLRIIERILADNPEVPMAKMLYEGMKNLYRGSEARKTEMYFQEAINRTKEKLNIAVDLLEETKKARNFWGSQLEKSIAGDVAILRTVDINSFKKLY